MWLPNLVISSPLVGTEISRLFFRVLCILASNLRILKTKASVEPLAADSQESSGIPFPSEERLKWTSVVVRTSQLPLPVVVF